ncbi:hypothetical protein B0G76_0309 [Paraburkholderia sp. BL23I1N1]|nr:hypothetical protein B0G76_0309 [Paraburkholderia sp. BL23I1N1]
MGGGAGASLPTQPQRRMHKKTRPIFIGRVFSLLTEPRTPTRPASHSFSLVFCQASNVGYSLDSLMRASSVVNCQLILALS